MVMCNIMSSIVKQTISISHEKNQPILHHRWHCHSGTGDSAMAGEAVELVAGLTRKQAHFNGF